VKKQQEIQLDFIIQSEPLTDKERKEISKYIADYKAKNKKKIKVKSKELEIDFIGGQGPFTKVEEQAISKSFKPQKLKSLLVGKQKL
jgi:chorismate mutase